MDPATAYTVGENEDVTNSSEPSLQTVTKSSGEGEDTTLINTINTISSSKETTNGMCYRLPQLLHLESYL